MTSGSKTCTVSKTRIFAKVYKPKRRSPLTGIKSQDQYPQDDMEHPLQSIRYRITIIKYPLAVRKIASGLAKR